MAAHISHGPAASLVYDAVGEGMPLLALHGAYSTRAEVRGYLEPLLAGRPIRRIYVDLPGHGDARPSSGVASSADAFALFDRLLRTEVPEGRFLLLAQSFGAVVARGIAARHPERVAGIALVCPYVSGEQKPAAGTVVRDDGVSRALDDAQRIAYEDYFVVRTARTLARFRDAVVPAMRDVDDDVFAAALDAMDAGADGADVPVLIVAAREDRWVGWERQLALGARYPSATVAVVADAGHALPHERPEIVAALLDEWLARVEVRFGPVRA